MALWCNETFLSDTLETRKPALPWSRASKICVSVHVDQLNIAHVDPSSKDGCAKQNWHSGYPEPGLAKKGDGEGQLWH